MVWVGGGVVDNRCIWEEEGTHDHLLALFGALLGQHVGLGQEDEESEQQRSHESCGHGYIVLEQQQKEGENGDQ